MSHMPTFGNASPSASVGRSFISFLLHGTDIVANTNGKAFALIGSPSIESTFGGRITTLRLTGAAQLGYVTIAQILGQNGAINAGAATIKALVNGVANAAVQALNAASANPLESAAFAGIAIPAGGTLGFTADFNALWDAGSLRALKLVMEVI